MSEVLQNPYSAAINIEIKCWSYYKTHWYDNAQDYVVIFPKVAIKTTTHGLVESLINLRCLKSYYLIQPHWGGYLAKKLESWWFEHRHAIILTGRLCANVLQLYANQASLNHQRRNVKNSLGSQAWSLLPYVITVLWLMQVPGRHFFLSLALPRLRAS